MQREKGITGWIFHIKFPYNFFLNKTCYTEYGNSLGGSGLLSCQNHYQNISIHIPVAKIPSKKSMQFITSHLTATTQSFDYFRSTRQNARLALPVHVVYHSHFCNSPLACGLKFCFTTSKHSCLEICKTFSINFSMILCTGEEGRNLFPFNSITQKVLKFCCKLEAGQLEMPKRRT